MAEYAEMLSSLKLYQELGRSVGRDNMPSSDVVQLSGLVTSIADSIGPVLQRIPLTFRQYTEHDFRHSKTLIEHMGDFIPAQTLGKLNALELSFLILAAMLHDIGMVVSDAEKVATLESSSFRAFRDQLHGDTADAIEDAKQQGKAYTAGLMEDALLAEYFRRLHPERVVSYLKHNFTHRLTFRDIDFTDHLAELCESHAWGVEETNDPLNPQKAIRNLDDNARFYRYRVNFQYLACCLRLADILDFDRSRTPLAVFRQIEFTESKSWEEWNKHLQVQGLEISPTRVSFDIPCTHPVFYVSVHQFLDTIDQELRQCKYLVENKPLETAKRYQIFLPPVTDRNKVRMKDPTYVAGAFRFQLEFDEIVRLLMDKSLYPSQSLFLRELLQNALDACRRKEAEIQSALERKHVYQGKIEIWDHSAKMSNPHVIIQDNGVGMSLRVVEQYFMRVGRSYYRSSEFDLERARLQASGIELEACSQFGIGILSCFLVADRFEVETFQEGHDPLHIVIEGLSKYFAIRRLPKHNPKFHRGSGTKITVYLRERMILNAFGVLSQFAVNVDFPISFDGAQTIPARLWEEEVNTSFNGNRHSDEITGTAQQGIGLSDVLSPMQIPFENWDFSRHIRGRAWFWLLRSNQGGACPSRGSLRISTRLQVSGLATIIMRLGKLIQVFEAYDQSTQPLLDKLRAERSNRARTIKAALESLMGEDLRWLHRLQSWEVAEQFGSADAFWGFVNELDYHWQTLSAKEQGKVIDAFSSRFSLEHRHPWEILRHRDWTAIPGILKELLEGSLSWINKLSFAEVSYLRLYYPLPEKVEAIALFGIRIPDGIIDWQAGQAQSAKMQIFPFPGGCQVDFRGPRAPRPAAHRLFISSNDAASALIPFARAALRCCTALVASEPENHNWRDWFTEIWNAPYPSNIMLELRRLEGQHIATECGFATALGGCVQILSKRELISTFGNRIPVASAKKEDGLLRTDGINALCLGRLLAEEYFEFRGASGA